VLFFPIRCQVSMVFLWNFLWSCTQLQTHRQPTNPETTNALAECKQGWDTLNPNCLFFVVCMLVCVCVFFLRCQVTVVFSWDLQWSCTRSLRLWSLDLLAVNDGSLDPLSWAPLFSSMRGFCSPIQFSHLLLSTSSSPMLKAWWNHFGPLTSILSSF